jgi:hypothetical protein
MDMRARGPSCANVVRRLRRSVPQDMHAVMCGWEEVRTPEGDRLYRSTATGLLSSRHPCAPLVPAHSPVLARARAHAPACVAQTVAVGAYRRRICNA